MTAFASPFSQITTMQAQEDIMEVNADLKGNMAMEEDNIDIDFELVDVHQDDGEDSMMDDGAAHLGGDGDQQMDDDVQEPRDQDEEITDYAGFQPPLQEIPMTEDVPQASDSLPSTVQPTNIFSDPTPSATIANPSDHLQPTQSSPTEFTTVPTTQIDAAQISPPEVADSSQRNETTGEPAAHDQGSPDHIGSIKNLFESPTIPEAVVQEPGPTSAEPADEAAKAGENPSGSQPSPEEDANQTADQSVNAGRGEITEKETEGDRDSQKRPEVEVEVRDETLEKPGEEESGDAQDTHDHEIVEAAENPSTDVFDHAEEGHVEENLVEPVAILVTCQNVQMSLFPPLEDDGTPETFLLPDDKHAGKAIRSLLKACSNILADSMTEHEELELVIPALGLTFRDCLSEAEHYSIRDMSDLHFQLHQNDGTEQPGPLHVILQVRPCLSGFIDQLYTLAAEGKGIRALADVKTAGQGDENDRRANHTLEKRTHDEHAESHQAGEDDEEDEFGEPDLPESEFEFEAIEEPSDESTNEPGQEVQHIAEGSLHAQEHEPSDHEAEEPSAVAKEVFSTGDDVYENQFPDGEGAVNTEFFVEETDTSHDDEARANEDDQHQIPTLAANNETSEGGDAQRHNMDPILESSQSLHSATQPEDSAAAVSHPLAEDDESTAGDHATPRATAEQHDQDTRDDNTSSVTATEAAGEAKTEVLGHDEATGGDEDFFEDDYDGGEASLHDEDAYDGELDFGLEEHPATEDNPQSLKRSRTAADEFGGDADADEGHQLKRTRSG